MRHGRWGNEFHVRLFRSDRRFQERNVHETLETVADVGSLRASIEHRPYRDLAHHIEKMARYARWGAEDLALRGRHASGAQMTFNPAWRFFREYIVYSGWKDGRAGLLLAMLSASSALMKYAHLQEIEWQTATEPVPAEPAFLLPPYPAEAPQEAWPKSSDS